MDGTQKSRKVQGRYPAPPPRGRRGTPPPETASAATGGARRAAAAADGGDRRRRTASFETLCRATGSGDRFGPSGPGEFRTREATYGPSGPTEYRRRVVPHLGPERAHVGPDMIHGP
jgi:hypothetical protein